MNQRSMRQQVEQCSLKTSPVCSKRHLQSGTNGALVVLFRCRHDDRSTLGRTLTQCCKIVAIVAIGVFGHIKLNLRLPGKALAERLQVLPVSVN